jgi:2-polyprenyl-6-methoxyphenol hydroxylase-like FAD-dependent oxidoreductase
MPDEGPDDFDAVIYGAGPVGAAVAIGLKQHGYRVCVREKRTEHQVVIDAGKSINLSLSTRGVALLTEIGVYDRLTPTLIPMVARRFSDGSTERYREPLLSINRNLLTIKLIEAAQAAGVTFEYGTGYVPGDVDAATGKVRLGEGRYCKPRVIVGCDGVHGKVCKLINPSEPQRSSRASEWGYYELCLPPAATAAMSKESFNNFHIWSGRGKGSGHFIVGLPNHDGSITLTLFALMSDMAGRYEGVDAFRAYLGEAYEGELGTLVSGVEEAVRGGFQRIWLNDHEHLAGELGGRSELGGGGDQGGSGTFVFLFGDAALGMEQFLGLAVNLGFEGAHRGFLEHWAKRRRGDADAGDAELQPRGRKIEADDDAFWHGLVRARNHLNAGAKALQLASTRNAASMRDGCDDPLGKAVRAAIEHAHGTTDIHTSGFESTHDWWSFCTVPLKVCTSCLLLATFFQP